MKTKDSDFAAPREAWEQKTASDEKEFAEGKQEVNDNSADLQNVEKLTSTISDVESKLASSHRKIIKFNEKLLPSSK